MRLLWFVVLIAFTMPVVHGETILKKVDVNADLEKGEELMLIYVESDEEVLIPIQGDVQVVGEDIDVTGEGILVPPGKHEIRALIRTESRMIGKEYFYYREICFPYFVENLLLAVKLPENSFPDVVSANFPSRASRDVTVAPDYINIQDGQAILIWNRSLRADESFQVGIFYPVKNKHGYYYAILVFAAVLISAICLTYYKRINRRQIKKITPSLSKNRKIELTDDEELILSLIKAKGGVALQNDIWKAECIPFSRPKVSQTLSKLENKGIIRREPFKRTYKIYITDENVL
ncbi:helix-turn-helix transcriptional regulator [Candidatus Pyrohabitans sp.]